MYLVCGEALYDLFVEEEGAGGQLGINGLISGSPLNVAIGIARLGGDVAYFGSLSTDMLGDRLLARLTKEDVDTSYVLRSGRRTTISMVGLDGAGHPAYVFYGTGSADTNIKHHDLPTLPETITGLHFGSYSSVVEPASGSFLSLCARYAERFISLDPNVRLNVEKDVAVWRDRLREYSGFADLIKVSREDLDLIYPDTPVEATVQEWLDRGVKLVVLTDGADSVRGWHKEHGCLDYTPAPVDVVDTVGAGDSFQAAFLMLLAEMGDGDPRRSMSALQPDQILRLFDFATNAARVTCGRRGADLPHRGDVVAGG